MDFIKTRGSLKKIKEFVTSFVYLPIDLHFRTYHEIFITPETTYFDCIDKYLTINLIYVSQQQNRGNQET